MGWPFEQGQEQGIRRQRETIVAQTVQAKSQFCFICIFVTFAQLCFYLSLNWDWQVYQEYTNQHSTVYFANGAGKTFYDFN